MKEDRKFTILYNDVLEELLKTNLSGQEFRVILLIIRKTKGFHKKDDYIALSQIQKKLGICKSRASRVITKLGLRKIITVVENSNGLTKKYCFNWDFRKWDVNMLNRTVAKKNNPTVAENGNHKRKSFKESKEEKKEEILKPENEGIKNLLENESKSIRTAYREKSDRHRVLEGDVSGLIASIGNKGF